MDKLNTGPPPPPCPPPETCPVVPDPSTTTPTIGPEPARVKRSGFRGDRLQRQRFGPDYADQDRTKTSKNNRGKNPKKQFPEEGCWGKPCNG